MKNRKTVTTWSVYKIANGETWFMCRTNWSKTNSAGVMEFNSETAALNEAIARDVVNPILIGWNSTGERIL